MDPWAQIAISAATGLVALVALVTAIAQKRRSERKREFELLHERIDREAQQRQERIDREAQQRQERIDREAQQREEATKALTERIDLEAQQREEATKALTERIDLEAQQREEAIQAALERSDRKFEALLARSDALAKGLAGIAERTARNEGVWEALTGGGPRGASKAPPAEDEIRGVAAQRSPDEPTS